MNSRHFWRLALILFFTAWAAKELYPPTSRPLLPEFENRAVNRDGAFSNIVAQTQTLQKENPNREFGNLWQAVTNNLSGTNSLARYFPDISTKSDADPNRAILHKLQRDVAGKIRLGLDLQGGTSFLMKMDTTNLKEKTDRERALNQAIEVLRRRVDKLGVSEPIIAPSGEDRIIIQMPGLAESDREETIATLKRPAYLEFRVVHPQSDTLVAQGIREPGYEVLYERVRGQDGSISRRPYLLEKKPARGLTGKYVKSAYPTLDPSSGRPEIIVNFNPEGGKIFGEITTEHVGNQVAIVLDNEVYSAPVIREPITQGHCSISGGSIDRQEAFEVANVLENPLETPVTLEETRTVGASLGEESVKAGLNASVIGIVAVAGFMLVYYMLAGFVANVALLLNTFILLGLMCSIGTTLTLPGIAGIVLTVGMAVDANVLIYERIREELAAGKSMRGALTAGYDKAFGTIFDSHITTLISSVILIVLGTGPVKGFGVALTIGVAMSLFTALVVTRLIFDYMLHKGWLTNLKMLHLIQGTKIDFMRWAKPAFAASWLLILIGIGYGFYRGKGVMGVDFAGGDALVMNFKERVSEDHLREAITKAGLGEPMIQYQKDPTGTGQTLKIIVGYQKGDAAQKELVKAFPKAGFELKGLEGVGPSVGKEIQKTAVVSMFWALLGILVYVAFRYEFSFACGAVIAIVHDVLMTMGWFFLTDRQLNAPMVAAILTIIGFSINDTIVIFDRIREDLKLGVRGTFKELLNFALNQTLSRTIITSGTVFLATMSLYLFGGSVINDFAFTFLVGILTGTYSSIYIASAFVFWWHKGERPATTTSAQVSMQEVANARV